jgi:hypothetical protein
LLLFAKNPLPAAVLDLYFPSPTQLPSYFWSPFSDTAHATPLISIYTLAIAIAKTPYNAQAQITRRFL